MVTRRKFITGLIVAAFTVGTVSGSPEAIADKNVAPSNTPRAYSFLPPSATIRVDPAGCGYFSCPRAGGPHHAIDYLVEPGQRVAAPISGKVEKIGWAYKGDNRYRYIAIRSDDGALLLRVFYVVAIARVGDVVSQGEPIAVADDVRQKYPNERKMLAHLHVEIAIDGVDVDPLRDGRIVVVKAIP